MVFVSIENGDGYSLHCVFSDKIVGRMYTVENHQKRKREETDKEGERKAAHALQAARAELAAGHPEEEEEEEVVVVDSTTRDERDDKGRETAIVLE